MESAIVAARAIAAPAKINLSLHVVGRRADGYHRLDGLVTFTAAGDRLEVDVADTDELVVTGPMAADVPSQGNILTKVLSEARQLAGRSGVRIDPLRLTLEKCLPVASGIGGGSADAAALLRHLAREHPSIAAALVGEVALALGADVPMCVHSCPARVSGIGEIVEPIHCMPTLSMVLVNPGVGVSTPAVFSRLANPEGSPPPPVPASGFGSSEALVSYLQACRNDLEAPARIVAPVIDEVTGALDRAGAQLVRMSGSGATVFGLFPSDSAALKAAATIAATEPRWWVEPTRSTQSPDEKAAA